MHPDVHDEPGEGFLNMTMRHIRLAVFGLAALVASARTARGADETVKIPQLEGKVTVVFDSFHIPHIYGDSVEDVYRALGYLHAKERLWQLELFRRRAAGRMAELLGPDGVESDTLMRKLRIRGSSEEAYKSDFLGADLKRRLEAYSEGVNTRLAELKPEDLPGPLKALGMKPDPWSPPDSLAWLKYMGWDQGGTDTDLWLGMMVEKLGWETVNELWPIDRPYEIATIPNQTPAKKMEFKGASLPCPDSKSRQVAALTREQSLELMRRARAGRFHDDEAPFGSNNWVVSGKKSASGKPILCNDPHLGFSIPMLWYMAHLVAPGLNVAGVTFPGTPFVIIGHNDRIAWGITNMQADQVDYFIEKVDPDKPTRYMHKGQWKDMTARVEKINVLSEAPREITVYSTVHGPVEKLDGAVVAMQWTGLGITLESRAIAGFNFARGLDDFLDALKFLDVPALSMVYADVEGNIAMAPYGHLPIRASGAGRVPVDGASGDFDWVGYIPHDELPLSINPAEGYLTSANGRPTPVGYPHHLGWMWDASYRTRRLHGVLGSGTKFTVEDMKTLQMDAMDLCAASLVPELLAAHDRSPYGDELVAGAVAALRNWDFVCSPNAVGPTIYVKWLEHYRDAVWNDEWAARGLDQPEGNWGFAGENDRDPEMEVLEYITRANPESIWFDDKRTSERERRDDMVKASFIKAVAELNEKAGSDLTAWRWGAVNVLRIGPLAPDPSLARGGQEVTGGPFTVNPGGTGGGVGGGASFRMVVDMADPARASGIYPGGQLEDPASPHYDDMIPLFVTGNYAPMLFHAKAEDFAGGEAEKRMVFAK